MIRYLFTMISVRKTLKEGKESKFVMLMRNWRLEVTQVKDGYTPVGDGPVNTLVYAGAHEKECLAQYLNSF